MRTPRTPSVAPTPLPSAALASLWALSEGGLGGALHALRTPFTGLFAGGLAAVFISLLAGSDPRPARAILRALGVALLVKAMASPHSPPTAYLAVAFQGLAGAGLFQLFGPRRIIAAVFGLLALLESALQKLLVLTLIYGAPLWEALDQFGAFVSGQTGLSPGFSGSVALMAAYTGLYAAAGAWIGWNAAGLPGQIASMQAEIPSVEPISASAPMEKKRGFRRRRLGTWVALACALALWAVLEQGGDGLKPWIILTRALAMIIFWFGILGPVVSWALQRLGRRPTASSQQALSLVADLPTQFLRVKAALSFARTYPARLRMAAALAWLLKET